MNIRKKVIETIRIRPDRAEMLKEKAFEISMKIKETVTESELVHFLLDTQAEKIDITKDGKLFIREKNETNK